MTNNTTSTNVTLTNNTASTSPLMVLNIGRHNVKRYIKKIVSNVNIIAESLSSEVKFENVTNPDGSPFVAKK